MGVERKGEFEPRIRDGGTVEVIAGSMFSGKTDELIRRLRRDKIARYDIQVFKPSIDNRFSDDEIGSHAGSRFKAIPVESAREIFEHLKVGVSTVAIDEAQFFDGEIVPVVQELAGQNIRVIVAGLDTDFRHEPFGPMPNLMACADRLDKYHAVCMVCGRDNATRTQRMIDNKPASYNEPVVVVGADEMYEARCREHHEVPGATKG